MRTNRFVLPIVIALCLTATAAPADELTQMIQKDLAALGYDPGKANGKPSVKTSVAISKFQAEYGLEVTGEASPQLAGILAAYVSQAKQAETAPVAARDPAELRAAQEACLQKRIEEREAREQKKRGFNRLMGAVGNLAGRFGGVDLSRQASDVYVAGASAEEIAGAAKDLGLTPDDIAACENP
ncbi:MAG TPA: peptidoglycan-binding domain-containing protein [Steroidobacteraceae bacterium]|nr:peptidoglycan-binding domain-containing protein [Steroidobacteraceae bacterium]HRX90997.1 peptidoglycan-binding domain-containing protein [Steroidobacteraceae bacterium]